MRTHLYSIVFWFERFLPELEEIVVDKKAQQLLDGPRAEAKTKSPANYYTYFPINDNFYRNAFGQFKKANLQMLRVRSEIPDSTVPPPTPCGRTRNHDATYLTLLSTFLVFIKYGRYEENLKV